MTAAVVISYNADRYLASCLQSLRAQGASPRVVVDNGSRDRSRAMAAAADSEHRWIDTGRNLGYGQAANIGVAATDDPYVLVCNPDLELHDGALKGLVTAIDADPGLALVGPRILNPDGTTYPSARTFPNLVDAIGHGLLGLVAPGNPFTRRYRRLDRDYGQPARVDWVSGACFVARRTAWEQIGGFSSDYFMYLEDVDLCWRFGAAGWRIGYEPAAVVVHVQGVSASQHPYRMLLAHHRSLWRFAVSTTTGCRRLALPVVAVGLAGRLVVASAQHRLAGDKRPVAAKVSEPGPVP